MPDDENHISTKSFSFFAATVLFSGGAEEVEGTPAPLPSQTMLWIPSSAGILPDGRQLEKLNIQ